MDVRHPASLQRVTLHAKSPLRRVLLAAVFAVLYAGALHWCYTTSGEPRATALAEAEKLRRANMTADEVASQEELTDMGYPVLQMSKDDSDILGAPDAGEELYPGLAADEESAPTITLEEAVKLNASALEAKVGKKKDEERPLPAKWLPNAWACAALFALCTATALTYLLCNWLKWFRAAVLYCPVSGSVELSDQLFAHVMPHAHRGKADITPLQLSARTGRLTFMFQRQRYEFLRPAEMQRLGGDLVYPKGPGLLPPPHGVRLVTPAADKPMSEFAEMRGLTQSQADERLEQFGANHLEIHTPEFLELYKQQLGSPIAMFQFFSATLWLLDEYWQFTAFTLVSIMMFEATTAFQRKKTFGTLNSMSAKPYGVQVFRANTWQAMSTRDVLPGDLISLKLHKACSEGADGEVKAPATQVEKMLAASNEIVPCDCIVLRGSAVVNEATLTGESVPQMKDALACVARDTPEGNVPFDLEGQHRVHALFSGTSMIQVNSGQNDDDDKAHARAQKAAATPADGGAPGPLPRTPDGGCLCVVARTGFSSSQGELIQMIEFSTQQVALETKETLLALLVLLCFALAASGYVLKKGLEEGDRTTHELLLRCTIILTSVVPRSLPTQMAMAVNTALMALHKAGIMCTEPFRVTFAGKISHCLFDKTGTLTTDTLVPVGVVNAMLKQTKKSGEARSEVPFKEASTEAAMVLAACHSLVKVAGAGVVGDPIEVAALRGVEWSYDADTCRSTPGAWLVPEKAAASLQAELASMKEGAARMEAEAKLQDLADQVVASKAKAAQSAISSVRIVQRHHFASELQRMSVVAEVNVKSAGGVGLPKSADGSKKLVCLVKGSPEAMHKLLNKEHCPEWYDVTYRRLAERGMRVLALACRWCSAEEQEGAAKQPRNWVERYLQFVGFVAFACRIRSDSRTARHPRLT